MQPGGRSEDVFIAGRCRAGFHHPMAEKRA
jgi:hypothetical protein